jgi:hypothetical protein
MMYKMPLVKGKPRKRNKDGTWRKKRSDAGKKREKTMSNNARDEQFKGFAGMLAKELRDQGLLDIGNTTKPLTDPPIDLEYEKIKHIIARRAYDLVDHAIGSMEPIDLQCCESYVEVVQGIPDMTELPKEQDSSVYFVDLGGYHGAEALEVLRNGEQDNE